MVIIYLLLGYLLTDTSVLCQNNSQCNSGTSTQCEKEDVSVSSSSSSPQEGDNVNLTCNHKCNDSNVMFKWKKDGEEIKGENKSVLVLQDVLTRNNGQYVCSVNSSCYCCDSQPQNLIVSSNTVIILVICGVSALGLIVIMGLLMKIKLKRDNDKHKERMRQREQAQQTGGAFPYTPRES